MPTTTNRPHGVIIIPILLSIFGVGYISEAWYELFISDYFSEIILLANGTALLFFSLYFVKRKQWAFKPVIVLSILNLLYSIFLFVESFVDGTITIIAFSIIIYYLSRSNVKEYFRDTHPSSNVFHFSSSSALPILYGYKSEVVSLLVPRGIKYLRKIFLTISILYILFFAYLISEFTSEVSEDGIIDKDTRRTKNLNFNKTYEYYFYLIQYFIVLGFGATWFITYFSMRKNKPWSRKMILLFCIVYVGYGKYLITSSLGDITLTFLGIIQASLAIVILIYMNRSNVLEYYRNLTPVATRH